MKDHIVLPLRKKVKGFALAYSLLLLLVLTICTSMLIYNTRSFERLFGSSYVQSDTLSQINLIIQAVTQYGTYPDPAAQDGIREALNKGRQQLSRFPMIKTGDEPRMLITAIRRTYESFSESIENLFAIPANIPPGQEFYVQYYEALEIGGYVDSYLKQLTLETMREGYSFYQMQSRFLKIVPFLMATLILLLAAATFHLDKWFARRIVHPLLSLASAAGNLASSQMDIPDIYVEEEDEIGELTRTFNKMKNDCQELLVTQREKNELSRKLYEERLRLSDIEKQLSFSQLAMLKQQINPHFLFNTLSLISQTACQEDADLTVELIQRLSTLLRHNLYTRQDRVTVRQELETLNSYIYIQESRFLNRISFWVDCRVGLDDYEIPTFLLQPLVENAVSHGVAPKKDGGVIRVKISLCRTYLRITVTDTGVGMDKTTLSRLRNGERLSDTQASGIGVANVAERLAILDPDSLFRIFSRQGEGTCVMMGLTPIPCLRKE